MLFLTESAAACVIFTILIQLAINNRRTAFVNDYPPVVTDRLRELGLIAEKPPVKKKDIIRKTIAMVFFSIAFALVLRFINGIETFAKASYTAYALWLVVDWYDFLVMDILLAPFDKFYRASGISTFEKSAVRFHFIGSLKGMVLGLFFAPLVGVLVVLLQMVV